MPCERRRKEIPQVSLQVQLERDKLPELYYKWGEHWRDYLRVVIQSKVKDVAPKFETLDYFTQRYWMLG